jgi:hypothetical protein
MWRILLLHPFLAFAAPLVFQAGPPQLSPNQGGVAFPEREQDYRKFPDSGSENLIPIRKPPAGVSANAMYGYNFDVSGKNRGWVVDGDEQHGWTLYLDMDGTGDLTAAEPARFEKIDGVFRLVKEITDGSDTGRFAFRSPTKKLGTRKSSVLRYRLLRSAGA